MKRRFILLLLVVTACAGYGHTDEGKKNIFQRGSAETESADKNVALRREYPFKGMSIKQIRRTKEYRLVQDAYGRNFSTGHLLRDADRTVSEKTATLHDMLGPIYRKAKKALLAKPVTNANFKALYAFAVLCRQKQALLANQPNDMKYCLIYLDNRIATGILLHACETLPDGELRRACVDAYIDSMDIVRQCELAGIWDKKFPSTAKKSGPRLVLVDDPTGWLLAMAVERGKAYDNLRRVTNDPYIKKALDPETLKKTTTRELAKRKQSVAASPGPGDRGMEPPGRRSKTTNPPNETAKPDGKKLLPAYQTSLRGSNPIRVRNPNEFSVSVGIRAGTKGRDFDVPPNGVKTIYVPNGKYDVYFVYSSKPDALFQGDGFTLRGNGVEIQIVKVVGGNYNIRRVK